MKQVLLLGDSIRMFYQERVRQLLGEDYQLSAPEENCRFAAYTLNSLRMWLPKVPKPDIIHWNNGLWDTAVLYPEDGIITHANHFRSLRLPRYPYKDMSKYKWPDTFIRNGRAEELMRDIKGAVSMRNFERVFADHADYPTSICHHEDPRDPRHARLGTVISFVMNLNTREMHICKGAPCETPFEVYRF